jgi:hypothetical protein
MPIVPSAAYATSLSKTALSFAYSHNRFRAFLNPLLQFSIHFSSKISRQNCEKEIPGQARNDGSRRPWMKLCNELIGQSHDKKTDFRDNSSSTSTIKKNPVYFSV